MKTSTLAALSLVTFILTAVAAPPADEASKNDIKNIQGTWTVSYSEQNGERRSDVEEVKKMRLTIKADTWTLEHHNNVKDKQVAALKLDATPRPKAAEFKFSEGLPAGETILAIYELSGDDLK